MTRNERLKLIEAKGPYVSVSELKWVISLVRELTEALEELAVYQFGINDKTGALVKQHCKEALKEKE